ncbi:MAG TPA: glycosyltransferase family 4 protein [Candidatus Dormibacteraeota bacterium]|jgi:glycosyltransferase involved in cell wall biosynthesis|nr:glycosyltransferase family 4 protein [Candidatus Dormibacteraeota bacterium]
MNVVLLCNEYPSVRTHAGIGTVVQILARGLQSRGHRVTVVGLGEPGEHSDEGVRVVTLQHRRTRFVGNLIERLELRRWLAHLAKTQRIDMIEVPDSQGLLPFGVSNCKVVVRLHLSFAAVTHVTGERHGRGLCFYEARNLAANSDWIAVSSYVLNLTRETFGITPNRFEVIHNPAVSIPTELPEVLNLPIKFILFAGHVCCRKGADRLAQAARLVMLENPSVHLVYVGGIYEKNGKPISDFIYETLGRDLSPRVHFLGRLPREMVLACMARATVFAFPTAVEGFPMVILEAMACGLPVVYSRVPAGAELIEDGVSGLLAEQDSPEDFATKISSLLDDPSWARRIAEAAKVRVAERFSTEQFLHATERFYEDCVSPR